jgi:hypothetical protein
MILLKKDQSTMKKITVDKIEDGMILFREVFGASGSILLSKGLSLTTAIGKRLKNWGITFVYIEGDEDAEGIQNVVQPSLENIQSGLIQKFSDVIDDPIMKKLFAAVFQYRLQNNNG